MTNPLAALAMKGIVPKEAHLRERRKSRSTEPTVVGKPDDHLREGRPTSSTETQKTGAERT